MVETNPEFNPSSEDETTSGDPLIMPFRELPLGARFSYLGSDHVWVVLERYGFGLIAEWTGVSPDAKLMQQVCSVAETIEECDELKVIVRE